MTWFDPPADPPPADPPPADPPPADPGPPPPGPEGTPPVATVSLGERAAAAAKLFPNNTKRGQHGLPSWPDGVAWCAKFVELVWGSVGADIGGLDNGAASFIEVYAKDHPGTLHNTPQPGDAVVYGYDPKKPPPRADHVAIVTSVQLNGTMTVTNGNWGDMVESESGIPAHVSTPDNPATNESGQEITGFVSPVPAGGGSPLIDAPENGVVAGAEQLRVAVAHPATVHSLGQSVVTGSSSVLVGVDQSPLAREGDRTADGGTIVKQSDDGVYSGG